MKFAGFVARLGLLGLCAAANYGFASPVDGSGVVTDWGFTPFNNTNEFGNWGNGANNQGDSGINGLDRGTTSNASWTECNNSSFPLDYPNGDFVPAPSGTNNGEKFDMEFLGWRTLPGGQINVLAISSVNPDAGGLSSGRTYHIGDVFMDVNGDGSYDFALTAGKWSTTNLDPLHLGDGAYDHQMDIGLYEINGSDDVHHVTADGGFGLNPTIAAGTNPLAVREGATQVSTDVGYDKGSFDYGTPFGTISETPDSTWILSWTFDAALLGPNYNPFTTTLHWTVECGNDVLDVGPVVPEPASLALVGLGLGSLSMLRRRKAAKAAAKA